MQDKKEFYLAVSVFLFFLTLVDISIIKYVLTHIQVNGTKYIEAGMMEYTNPVDHRKLYIPIYEKGDN